MNPLLEKMTGTAALSDQIIASDLLITAKSGVRNYAAALTEAASPQVRQTLRRHLEDAIQMHAQVMAYMEHKGWYNYHDMSAQIQLDLQNAKTAMNLLP